MFVKDERFITPSWNATLWRYMSFEKFLDIIHNQTLHFTNVTILSDQREAEIPWKNMDQLLENIPRRGGGIAKEELELAHVYGDLSAKRKSSFVNCWILSPNESYALWKIYLSGNKTGVAIKTRTKNIIDSINAKNKSVNELKVFLGKVEYTDFIKREINIASTITTKSKAYKFENECRLLIFKEPEYDYINDIYEQKIENFIKLKVDIDILINEIYISPFGGDMFYKVFVSTIKKLKPSFLSKIQESLIIEK